MFKAISKWHRKRLRKLDLEILWPQCKKCAKENVDGESFVDMDCARAAFALHAFSDPAWTKDYTEGELKKIIEGLT